MPALELALAEAGCEATPVSPDVLAWASSLGHHARITAVVERAALPQLASGSRASQVGLRLHGVSDPGNVGTLVRAADVLGPAHVVIGDGTADPLAPKAVRASMGALFRVPIVRLVDAPPARRVALDARARRRSGMSSSSCRSRSSSAPSAPGFRIRSFAPPMRPRRSRSRPAASRSTSRWRERSPSTNSAEGRPDMPAPSFDDLLAARKLLAPTPIWHTPIQTSRTLGELVGVDDLRLKLELFQVTGSFKPRGAFCRSRRSTRRISPAE